VKVSPYVETSYKMSRPRKRTRGTRKKCVQKITSCQSFIRKENYEYIRRCSSRSRYVQETYASRSTSSPRTHGSDDGVLIEAQRLDDWSPENAFRDAEFDFNYRMNRKSPISRVFSLIFDFSWIC